jgi:hypothetical protein
VIHRQRTTDALLPCRDPGRLPVITSVQAKDKRAVREGDSRRKPGSGPAAGRIAKNARASSAREGSPDPRDRPLLLVDIDGVISLFSFEPESRPEGAFHSIDGIPHFLSSGAAEHLLALVPDFELVWASGWEEKANEYLPHLLGLPELPHLSFERSMGRTNAHWKLDAIDAYAGATRPLAWIDDAFNDACHEWANMREAPTLLVRTLPPSGLTGREAEMLERWAISLRDQIIP